MSDSGVNKISVLVDKIEDFDALILELLQISEEETADSLTTILSFILNNFDLTAGIVSVLNPVAFKSHSIVHKYASTVDSDLINLADYLNRIKLNAGSIDLNDISASFNVTLMNRHELPNTLNFIRNEFKLRMGNFASISFFSEKRYSEEEQSLLQRLLMFTATTIKLKLDEQQKFSVLNQELSLYKNLASNTLEMICMHDPDGTYTFVSESVIEILGYEPSELIGTSPYNIFHHDDLERIMKDSHEPALRGEKYFNMEYRIRKKDGHFIWFNTTTQPIVNAQGEVTALQTTSRNIDAKKRMEELFVETQRMTKTGGWELDLQTMEFYGTDYAYEIHDLDPSEIVTLERELSHYPDDGSRDKVLESITNCAKKNKPFEITVPFISASNQHKYIRAKGKAITHKGVAYKLVGTFQDVTEQVKLDTLFKQSQKLANIGGWEYDIWSGDLFITDGVCDICEIPHHTRLHFEELLLFFPNDGPRKKVKDIVTKAMQTGKKQEFQLPAISSSGKHKYVHAILKPVHIEKKLVKIVGTLQDVTEKTKIEYFLRDTQEVAKVGGWDYYYSTGDLYWSEEMYAIHEMEIGTPVNPEFMTKFFTGEAVDRIQTALKDSLITGMPYEIESQLITAKGNIKFVRIIGNPLSSDGEVFRIYGTYQDITESNRYIQQISDQNIQLAKEKQTRDKLYAILAHDLRNSMSGVNSLLGMVIDEIESEKHDLLETIEHLRLVLNSSVNGIKLLENIQGWIKVQSGELSTMPEFFDIKSRVKACLELLNPMVKSKNITINTHFDSNTQVFADPQMITTIIRNLINNAIKYSYDDSVIDVSVIENRDKKVQCITIKDYGIGMPESVKQNLFNQKNRPQRDGTAQEAGTGLGLLLTNELAAMNHCKLTVESEDKKGSAFTLCVPTTNEHE